MSDVLDQQAEGQPSEEDGPNLKQLRQLAKKGEKVEGLEAELAAAKRELAISKLGIDDSTPLGKLFLKDPDLDLSDVDAVKAAAKELGVPFKDGVQPEAQVEETPAEPTGTDERRALAAEAVPDDGEDHRHPTESANDAYKVEMDRGRTEEEALGAWVAAKAAAALEGDERAIYRGPTG